MPSPEPLLVAAALVVDDSGRIFFQKRSPTRKLFPDTWDVVGGHLEPGETVQEALHREVYEETGWRVSQVLAKIGDYRYTGEDGLTRLEADFLVRVDGDLSNPQLEQGKHTEFRWLTEHELDLLDYNAEVTGGMIRRLAEDGFAVLRGLGT